MSRARGIRKALLAGFIALGLSSTAFAQTSAPASGLGQSWPNATDVSTSPNWHVYVFWLQGIKYVQINDLGGNVHAAIATANGTTIVLPVGVDSQNVTTGHACQQLDCSGPGVTTQSSAASPIAPDAQVVYRDSSTTVTATPQRNSVTTFAVTQTVTQMQTCPELGCSGAGVATKIKQ